MTYSGTKFEVASSNSIGGMHLQDIYYLNFELYLGVKVTRNVVQYFLHHVTYLGTNFEVATYRLDRGVIVMVKPGLPAEICLELDSNCEIKWVKINTSNQVQTLVGNY